MGGLWEAGKALKEGWEAEVKKRRRVGWQVGSVGRPGRRFEGMVGSHSKEAGRKGWDARR